MAVETLSVSDPTLLADIRRYGKFDPAGCYQCGSCTLTCDLVDDSATFPRKSIRYALLGLRQPLVNSLDPWVCHDCGDCSGVCPRQAEPRISMLTLRRFLSAQYDWTGIAPKLLQSTAWYLGSLIFVAALTFLLILGYHLWYVKMPAAQFVTTPLGLEHMFPLMTYYTLTVFLVPLLLLLSRVFRIWRLTMNGERAHIPFSSYVAESWTYVYHSMTHSLLRKCPDQGRWFSHWCLALGTVMMLAIKLFGLKWFQTDNLYPFYNPQRWVGYLATGLILYGLGEIFLGRLRAQKEIYKETRFQDLVLPVLLVLTVLSGLAAHIFRYVGFGLTCHFLYALHIVIATPMLLVEMSFGKWSHMVYRPLALYFLAVRQRAGRQAPAAEVVPHAV
ncbi:MAG: 4Fe-4S dicluster domain-containing protein [Candidatus Korobacteraceae bacterium]|jgi:ferredoxin